MLFSFHFLNRQVGHRNSSSAVLAILPGVYRNVLICGISTQLHDLQTDWDDEIHSDDADFGRSGFHRASVIRPSYVYAADVREIAGVIGRVDACGWIQCDNVWLACSW